MDFKQLSTQGGIATMITTAATAATTPHDTMSVISLGIQFLVSLALIFLNEKKAG